MTITLRKQNLAGIIGLTGGALGVLAGLSQTLIGGRIPTWAGDKSNPTGLGLLTILLSLTAMSCAHTLRGGTPASPQRRATVIVGLLVPAVLCLSTVGRLWYLPGAFLAAAAITTAAGDLGELRRVARQQRLPAILSMLGGFELLMAVAAAPLFTTVVGIGGGLALVAAPWSPGGKPARWGLILAGTIPFALLTWWSVATPLLAVVAVSIGIATMRKPMIHDESTKRTDANPVNGLTVDVRDRVRSTPSRR